ncbi:DNA polymerase iota-like [Anneissia japonica]|uniref:DNA polymerase iota-like n=1 Tax=Anneissia japonica TaxID=1529436 RepID=UPI001425A617|nr:DNA polymerase iota-like [Anneissia japonica]
MANRIKRYFEEVDSDDADDYVESESEWRQGWEASSSSLTEFTPKSMQSISGLQSTSVSEHKRTIIHIDIDCFYAQVEMILDPALRDKPLGIQQKNIVVTCNYVARGRGISKLSYVNDAVKLCPELVLVSGEDLTKYRKMSYKVTDYFLKFCPLVERLGFDENFIDVTDLVKSRQMTGKVCDVEGHTYSESSDEKVPRIHCLCGCYQRLAIGSQIASELRSGLKDSLGLTCCAGIAHNKLLSKLVAGTHKPNQQTVLFPHQADEMMLSLKNIKQIPGIGSSMSKRLAAMGIVSVQQLRSAQLNCIQQELGAQLAGIILNLSHGRDPTPVVQTGAPQSLSEEDSFKKCNSVEDARNRSRKLIRSLLRRLKEDGRVPHTLRVAIRKFSLPKQWTRENRQCALPESILQNANLDDDTVTEKLLDVAMQLFIKLVDTSKPFHLTLISICFTKLEDHLKKPSIVTYFKRFAKEQGCQEADGSKDLRHKVLDSSVSVNHERNQDGNVVLQTAEKLYTKKKLRIDSWMAGNSAETKNTLQITDSRKQRMPDQKQELKTEINLGDKLQNKVMFASDESVEKNANSFFGSRGFNSEPLLSLKHSMTTEGTKKQQSALSENPENIELPPDVDPSVFVELPLSVQRELVENWKREKSRCSKTEPPRTSNIKPKGTKKSIKDFFATK